MVLTSASYCMVIVGYGEGYILNEEIHRRIGFLFQFLYVNQTFAPSPDQAVRNLYECFGADGKLVLHYCKSQAWG